MQSRLNATVVLRGAGTAIVVDVDQGLLPAVVHWGADPGPLTATDVAVLRTGGIDPIAGNALDEPVRVAVLPEHWQGWAGRPGISGSRAGAAWSPKFTVTSVTLDGAPVVGVVEATAGTVEATASDPEAGLDLSLWIELAAAGVVRMRAALTNTAASAYQLDDLVLALPVPQAAAEILDFAGRWGDERVAQRRAMQVGTHLREGRRGRTGADSAMLLHLGSPGFGFADGEIWAVHTGWSGNHIHYAERLASGAQVIGGGELLLPGEIVLGPGESATPRPGCTGRTASASTAWPAASTPCCASAPSIRPHLAPSR